MNRQGMLLMVIAQLMLVVIIMTMSYILVMRQDSVDSTEVVQQAQSRIAMHAALMYIQEGSRLGWAHKLGELATSNHAALHGWPATVGLAYGWTDTRDGSLGPRGPRPWGAGPNSNDIPPPSWWSFTTIPYLPFPEDTDLPGPASRRFPCPGSAMRAPLAVPELTPYATDGRYNYNPIRRGAQNGPEPWPLPKSLDFYPMAALDPQPQADNWTTFKQGLETSVASRGNTMQAELPENRHVLRSHTVGKAWFRIYRETLEDHDADQFAHQIDQSGQNLVSWPFDSVALYDPNYPQLKNWNVFIISCGAGGTRGYRWWNLNQGDPRRGLEPVTARESGFFSSEAEFERLKEQEYIMWFRVHWSPLTGGYANSRTNGSGARKPGSGKSGLGAFTESGLLNFWKRSWRNGTFRGNNNSTAGHMQNRTRVISSQGGNFQFIQRLPAEPPQLVIYETTCIHVT